VTVIDVNYVIAKIPEGKNGETIVAMEDRCPHKSAFLSEGRVTSTGYLQCAYHGWSFDGKDGTCVEIPQVVTKGGEKPTLTARACGTAVPAMIEQGMVWLFPGGNLEKALQAPLPPTVPEMDMDAFSTCTVVRDFPIDYSILLENILDPDHGLFAHGVRGFDLYSASRDEPQTIKKNFSIMERGGELAHGWMPSRS
jgi:phenylpropionate dioxygenase-like ring-hydroxylating dioxygenase large terminal subunit